MKSFKAILFSTVLAGTVLSAGCGKDGVGLNIFSIDDDKQLGLQTKSQIEADPSQFPILSPSTHAAAYAYINALRDDIPVSYTHLDVYKRQAHAPSQPVRIHPQLFRQNSWIEDEISIPIAFKFHLFFSCDRWFR